MFEKEHQLLKKMHRLSESRYQKLIEEQNYTGYGRHTELICVNAGILGPAGLLIALMFSLQKNKKIGLCYRMPKELIGKQITKHGTKMDEMLKNY